MRTSRREGLIRARMIGARAAGPDSSVLIFLDAHVEATSGWLVPLLSLIAGDRTRVALPVVDDLSDETFAYLPTEDDATRGGLDRKLMHRYVT